MKILIINQTEVGQLLPYDEAIEAMRGAFTALAQGKTIQPLRPILWLPEKVGALGMMPAYLEPIEAMGIKVVSVFPGNHGTEYDSHQGSVMLFETKNGRLLSLMDASEMTAVRTAAATAVATDLLSHPEATDLAILGSGVQARSHIAAMLEVRPSIKRVKIWSRNGEHAAHFAKRAAQKFGVEVVTADSVADAVAGTQIICTTTAAPEPILLNEMLEQGMHINAVGSSVPFAREIDSATMAQATLFVDRKESTVNESGDFLMAKADGVIDEDSIEAEVGEILIGEHPGRSSYQEITLFKSLGLAIEDVAAAHHIYQKAVEKGVGTWVELGGERPEF
ncbi:MAG: ornithine cyclodeaminase family protein [Anaerolineae bacterium]